MTFCNEQYNPCIAAETRFVILIYLNVETIPAANEMNMPGNGRIGVYPVSGGNPMLGVFLSPDNYVQLPGYSQSFNRYSYALNNPLAYTDPTGEFFWAALPLVVKIAIGVGAGIGAYTGYKIGEAKGASGLGMVGYVFGGAVIGGFSGYLGGTIAAGGGIMANTGAIMMSSYTNSMGMTMLSGGDMAPSISFGVASYNFTQGEWGFLGKPGNSTLENIGYGLGALANIQDVFAWNQGTNIKVYSHNNPFKGGAPHSYVKGDGIDISVANAVPSGSSNMFQYAWRVITNKIYRTASYYSVHNNGSDWVVNLNNVRAHRLVEKTNNIIAGKGLYGKGNLKFGPGFGCVQHSSRALLASGVWYIPFNPLPQMLTIQLAIRQVGIYASPYLINY